MKWCVALVLFIANSAVARPCSNSSDVRDICEVTISDMRPTQFAVGQREVAARAGKLAQMSSHKLEKYIEDNPAIVVIGPEGRVYIVDHQHLACALTTIGVEQMNAEVKDNLSALNETDFWQTMELRGWVRLYDEKGVGPLPHEKLPSSLANMGDDVYRGLAWFVRSQGGYDGTDVLYGDFMWADFFRTRVDIGTSDDEFQIAVKKAIPIAHSDEAKNLPGWKKK